MADLDMARQFLAAEFESAGLPHTAGSILAGISPFGKGAYIAAVAAALSTRHSPGGLDALIEDLADDVETCVSSAVSYLASDRGWDDYGIYRDEAADRYRALPDRIRALAARQPVGEPVCSTCRGEIRPDALTETTCDRALRYVAERPTGYAECPVTGLPFYGNMEHPKHGLIAMYGGPLDVYSAPELQDNDGELRRERYDLDADRWVEGGEPLGYFYREQQPDDARQPVGQEPFGWWLQDDNGVGYFSHTIQPAALYAHRTTPGYSATPLYAPRTAE